jgi:hypothetical protein
LVCFFVVLFLGVEKNMLLGTNFYSRGTSSAISGDSASYGVLSLQQHHKATKESELVASQVVVGVHEFCCGILPFQLLWFCHLLLAARDRFFLFFFFFFFRWEVSS